MRRIAVEDFREYQRDRFVDAQTSPAARLAPTWLLTHESGVEGSIREELTRDGWSRVVFDLPPGRVRGAELLFYVNADATTQDRPMLLVVNGHCLRHRQDRVRMFTGGWDRARIPARFLKAGRNEFTFAESGVLHVDPGPGRASSRSFDQGRTWHTDALGPARALAGEYLVRLRLKGYPPAGQLTSPVVDLADPGHEGAIAPAARFRRLRLRSRQLSPLGTRIRFELRSGSTPVFDPGCWTPWEQRTSLSRPGRFAQWRATLSAASADRTPVLKGVVLEVEAGAGRRSGGQVRLVELDQPEIVRSSYGFAWLAPHHRVSRLVEQYRLEEVVAAGRTELEKLALLRDWVHSQWLGWQSDKYPYCPPWDPLEILAVTKGNWGYGMCTHYAAVMAGCAAALGYASRVVIVDHHCLAEVWSEELQKWVLEDAGPKREYDATYEIDGVPVNALELHQALAQGERDRLQANKLPQKQVEPMVDYVESFCRFGIALRNDHLVAPEPAELRHGQDQYHYDGYLWWTDDLDPQYPEYSLQSSRPGDFYWSIDQTRLYLQATEDAGVLQVDAETCTPNFSHYLVRFDEGEWVRADALPRWSLHPGANTLEVRSVNAFGRQGRIARARVERGPEQAGRSR